MRGHGLFKIDFFPDFQEMCGICQNFIFVTAHFLAEPLRYSAETYLGNWVVV